MAGQFDARGQARLAEATRVVEGLARSPLNRLAGGRLAGPDAQWPTWKVRCTGAASSGTPGLYPGELLSLAYAPGGSSPVGWTAPDVGPVWLVPADPDAVLAKDDEGVAVVVGDHGGRSVLCVVGGGGGGGVVAAVSSQANNGTQWTTGFTLGWTSTGDTAQLGVEQVELKPLKYGEPLAVGDPVLCIDTGKRGTANRRRLRTERLGGGLGNFRTISVVTSVFCVGDAIGFSSDQAFAPPQTGGSQP